MLASILISGISAVLLLYWFRYACLLLLRTHQEPAVVARVAEANGLNLLAVQGQLRSPESGNWQAVERALDHDYEILAFLLEHAAELGGSRLERLALGMDFRLLQAWYRLVQSVAPDNARQALTEMAAVLTRMSVMVGEKSETAV
jgi:hypothetical protein